MRTNLRTTALAATLLVAGVVVWALLLAPVVISIHRFMVLEEVTRTYVRPVGEPALQAQALGCIRERPGAGCCCRHQVFLVCSREPAPEGRARPRDERRSA